MESKTNKKNTKIPLFATPIFLGGRGVKVLYNPQ